MERTLEGNLRLYCARGVVRGPKCVHVRIDEEGDAEFSVVATLEREASRVLCGQSILSAQMVGSPACVTVWV